MAAGRLTLARSERRSRRCWYCECWRRWRSGRKWKGSRSRWNSALRWHWHRHRCSRRLSAFTSTARRVRMPACAYGGKAAMLHARRCDYYLVGAPAPLHDGRHHVDVDIHSSQIPTGPEVEVLDFSNVPWQAGQNVAGEAYIYAYLQCGWRRDVRNKGVEGWDGTHAPRLRVEGPPPCSRGWMRSNSPSAAGFFWGGWQAATVRGGTAVAGFFGGIVVGHCVLTKWGTARKFDV